MSRDALAFRLVLGAVLIGTLGPAVAGTFFSEPPAIAGAPYSGVTTRQSTTVFSDGNRIVRTDTVRYFRDGQGRTRTERGFEDATGSAIPSATVITINDPVSGQRYVLHPKSKTVSVYKLAAGGAEPAPEMTTPDFTAPFALLGFGMGIGAGPRTEASAATTLLGQKVINGLTVTGTRLVRTIPTGVLGNEQPITSTLDQWISPDLGVPVQITQTSSIGGKLTLDLGQVVRAEPNASLFVPPADYARREIKPVSAASVTIAPAMVATATAAAGKP
jgi:hypothetical protein